MPNFYLQPTSYDSLFFELHATTDISVSLPSKLTSYPIETGQKVTDNIVLDPVTVSFTGVLSDVGNFSFLGQITNSIQNYLSNTNPDNNTQLSLEDYIFELRKMRDEKEVFSVFFSHEQSGIDPIDYAILTTFELTKSTEQGASWTVKLELQEVRFANQATVTAEARSDWQNILTSNQKGAGNTSGNTQAQKTSTIKGLTDSAVIDSSGEVIDTKWGGGELFTGQI